MPGGDPTFNSVGRPGDVQARGASGWGPRSLVSLIRSFLFPSAPVDNAVIRADGVTGKLQGSTVIVTDAGAVTGVAALTMSGNLAVGLGTGSSSITINSQGSPNSNGDLLFQKTGVNVWNWRVAGNMTGSDVGADIIFSARTDAGVVIDSPIQVTRATGAAMTLTRPVVHSSTTDATTATTAGFKTAGGVGVAKTLISALGQGWGVASTATAGGTTVLAQASAVIQTFTGVTTETITMPAANLWGAGIAVIYIINNQSSGTVTPTRAGSDTFQGGGTTSAVLTTTTTIFASDGVSVWLKLSAA